jgi:hypothetical protein
MDAVSAEKSERGAGEMTNKTWIGGRNNNAGNPRDWSPNGVPQPGDDLIITQGVMNVSGNALAGDTLSIDAPFGAPPIDINTRAAAELDLSVRGGGKVNVHVDGTLILDDLVQNAAHLKFSGGTIRFIGTSTFNGDGGSTGSTVFDDSNLVGSGTLRLLGGNHNGDAMEIDGSVGRGLTFELGGGAPTMSLRIDDPGKFHGLIDLTPATFPGFPSAFDFVAFMGLHATSANLHDDMLQMFNGRKLVDAVRLSGGSGLQLEQNRQGVMLSAGRFGESQQPGGPGTIIPLHVS